MKWLICVGGKPFYTMNSKEGAINLKNELMLIHKVSFTIQEKLDFGFNPIENYQENFNEGLRIAKLEKMEGLK